MSANDLAAGIAIGVSIQVFFGGLLGAWVAEQKRRSVGEGWLLGALLGMIGVLIEALLPAR